MHKGIFRRTWGIWILTVLLGLTVVVIGFLASYGFMSGRELYEQGVIYEMETDASSTSIKVLDIDPSPLEIDDETYYLVKHNHGVSFLRTDASEIKQILGFLREREVVHYQRFGEALMDVQDNVKPMNLYCK